MDSSDHIFQKEIVYREQMAPFRLAVMTFLEPYCWQALHRGRRAHASACGPMDGFWGVIDVQMLETNWNRMPAALQPDTAFTLWCSASDSPAGRRFADTALYWQASFGGLGEAINRFLPAARQMLGGLTDESFHEGHPAPLAHPDLPPAFGPPRIRFRL